MSDIASDCVVNEKLMPCLASFFDAMSGVKKLMYFHAVIASPHTAFKASYNYLAIVCSGYFYKFDLGHQKLVSTNKYQILKGETKMKGVSFFSVYSL